MAISRMQQPRQQYGLGSLVKKAFKGVKKIIKSPIGKAALLGGLGFGIPGTGFKGLIGKGAAGGLWKKLAGSKLGGWFGGLTGGQKIFTGLAGAGIAAPFIQKALGYGPYKENEEEEEVDWTQVPSSILNLRNQAQDYYRAAKPDYIGSPFMVDKSFVPQNFYAADGGRAGLLNGGEAGEAQLEQMLRAEYLKYKNKGGTMPYEQFKILVMKQAQQGQMPNQMMAAGGRIARPGYRFGGNPHEATQGSAGAGQTGGWAGGAGGGQDGRSQALQTIAATSRPKKHITKKGDGEGVNRMLSNINTVNRLKNFSTTRNPLELLKVNPLLLGGSFLYNKFRNKSDSAMAPGDEDDVPGNLRADVSASDINRLMGTTYGTTGQQKYQPNQDIDTIRTIEGPFLNETISDEEIRDVLNRKITKPTGIFAAKGGRIGAQEGGLMDLGGQEKDYRDNGGFVPIGGEERADDVPARLSKNEFVFTADAVRAAGGGDIDAGSKVMQNVMDNLEQGGEVSEESQGQNPAQGMYNNYEQLQSRVA